MINPANASSHDVDHIHRFAGVVAVGFDHVQYHERFFASAFGVGHWRVDLAFDSRKPCFIGKYEPDFGGGTAGLILFAVGIQEALLRAGEPSIRFSGDITRQIVLYLFAGGFAVAAGVFWLLNRPR